MIDTLTDAQLASSRARTHERINELIVAPPRRSRRLPALALAAGAAVAAVVVFTPAQPTVATAATVLRALEPEPLPTLGPGEYYAVRVVQRRADDPTEALDTRYWIDADGKGRERAVYRDEVKRDEPLRDAGDALPTDPKALPAYLRAKAQAMRPERERKRDSEPTTRDYVLAAAQMVFDPRGTPPETLRAVFGFLAGLPGMKLLGDVTDPLGRPGKAVAADGDHVNDEGVGHQLIVNPDTGRPLAFIHYRREGGVSRPWLETIRTEGVVRDMKSIP
jgi:hypothetical protein